ncbi:protease complex subunit PrcB family protein [Skermanella mucosa]|uniref:protease complex subunit PrcB family protein n=1 Tax=Skermanella mucosa TaxID=1789672 RepID=UPI00192AC44C|nr:protease complex subunit PrcB family protein [Skermanella mucosa]UEM22502.1 protease complex subunit PrcB family protein [Skermanella mucosa]
MPKFLLAALGAVLISATGCTSAMNLLAGEPLSNPEGARIAQAPGIDGQFEWSGAQASVQGRTTIVARTQEQWENLWQLAATPAPGPLPEGWMGIGVFLGMRQTAGYGVAIENIAEQVTTDRQFIEQGLPASRELVVSYGERAPEPGAMTAQVLTSPYVIRIVRRDDSPIRFAQTR